MQKCSLNGQWNCLPDLQDVGIKNKWFHHKNLQNLVSDFIPLKIPTSFNLIEGYELFEGIFWHFFEFKLDSKYNPTLYDYQLCFKGANYNTKVWLNSFFIGEHNGGFTPFKFLVNKYLHEESNLLVVRVDNTRQKDGIPSLYFDWFNWGGIYRDVDLLILNKSRINDLRITTKLITKKKAKIEISYKIIGEVKLKWQISDCKDQSVSQYGKIDHKSSNGDLKLIIENPKLWSPDTPHLYQFQLLRESSEKEILYQSNFGIRQIEVLNRSIYLNKKQIKLRGICLHEEYMPYGRTIPYEKRKEDLERIKALGLNSVRTAHYPHDESLIDIADELGLLILEEIPVYWDCSYKSRKTFVLAAKMLRELIKRDFNHPSVIWWSVGNEIPTSKPECSRFMKNLMNFARMHDSTRIVTFVSRKLTSDLFRRNADIATLNTYFGWYFGNVKMLSLILDWTYIPLFHKPWIFTEFGAGAKYGVRDKVKSPHKFSEEYQLRLLDYTIRTINSKEYFSGWFIWIFRDFKTILKNNEYQQGYNRKGIVSEKSHEKKLMYNHLPKMLNKKRKIINTRLLGLMLWIIFFPFSRLLTTHLVTFLATNIDKKSYERGIRRLSDTNQNF